MRASGPRVRWPHARAVCGRRRTRLAEKPALVLALLIDGQGEVVTREALRGRAWPSGTFVDFDNNLNSAVTTLRQALGDSARRPVCIETIPKVGYRLLGRVEPAVAMPPPAARAAERRGVAGTLSLLLAAACLVLAGSVWTHVPPPDSDRAATGVRVAANATARAAFARGMYLRSRFGIDANGAERLTAARDAFRDAAAADPRFADAPAEEGETLVDMAFAGALPFESGMTAARGAAERALSLEPRHPVAARVKGMTLLFLEWDFAGSRRWLDRATAGADDARTWIARATWLGAAGNADAAVQAAENAVSRDPAAWYVRADLAMFYLAAGRPASALDDARRVLEVAPEFLPARSYALLACERLGHWEEAAAHARALLRTSGASPAELDRAETLDGRAAIAVWREWQLARLETQTQGGRAASALPFARRLAAAGQREAALSSLQEAFDSRQALLVLLRIYPEFVSLQGDPVFEAISARLRAERRGTSPAAMD
ncbi:MAG: winged helix-turn-helix domain-containing protein [Vicinamibacterales bacterium]